MRYTGSFHIIQELEPDDDYAGFIFGYQDNGYLIMDLLSDLMLHIACVENFMYVYGRESYKDFSLGPVHTPMDYKAFISKLWTPAQGQVISCVMHCGILVPLRAKHNCYGTIPQFHGVSTPPIAGTCFITQPVG